MSEFGHDRLDKMEYRIQRLSESKATRKDLLKLRSDFHTAIQKLEHDMLTTIRQILEDRD
jgi:hypothetical protein